MKNILFLSAIIVSLNCNAADKTEKDVACAGLTATFEMCDKEPLCYFSGMRNLGMPIIPINKEETLGDLKKRLVTQRVPLLYGRNMDVWGYSWSKYKVSQHDPKDFSIKGFLAHERDKVGSIPTRKDPIFGCAYKTLIFKNLNPKICFCMVNGLKKVTL